MSGHPDVVGIFAGKQLRAPKIPNHTPAFNFLVETSLDQEIEGWSMIWNFRSSQLFAGKNADDIWMPRHHKSQQWHLDNIALAEGHFLGPMFREFQRAKHLGQLRNLSPLTFP